MRRFPLPSLDQVDPAFQCTFIKKEHGPKLDKELRLSHLLIGVCAQVSQLFIKYWDVFIDKGLFVPIKDYECIIDTGSARPISVKKINYGPHKTPVMGKCITALSKLGQISQVFNGR